MFNKFKYVNKSNSTIGVQCIAKGKCEFRFTSLCKKCENNIGMKEDKNYFKLKEI